jgi:hypothetical protein
VSSVETVSKKRERRPAAKRAGAADGATGPEDYRHLYRRALAARDEAIREADRLGSAWEASVVERNGLERALVELLEVTRLKRGYSPRVFVARLRAKAALRRAGGAHRSSRSPA